MRLEREVRGEERDHEFMVWIEREMCGGGGGGDLFKYLNKS